MGVEVGRQAFDTRCGQAPCGDPNEVDEGGRTNQRQVGSGGGRPNTRLEPGSRRSDIGEHREPDPPGRVTSGSTASSSAGSSDARPNPSSAGPNPAASLRATPRFRLRGRLPEPPSRPSGERPAGAGPPHALKATEQAVPLRAPEGCSRHRTWRCCMPTSTWPTARTSGTVAHLETRNSVQSFRSGSFQSHFTPGLIILGCWRARPNSGRIRRAPWAVWATS